MRTNNDANIPKGVLIRNLNLKIKFLIFFSIFWSIFITVASVLIWFFTPEWEMAVVLLITLPLYLYVGGYLQIKVCKQKPKQLRDDNAEAK